MSYHHNMTIFKMSVLITKNQPSHGNRILVGLNKSYTDEYPVCICYLFTCTCIKHNKYLLKSQ